MLDQTRRRARAAALRLRSAGAAALAPRAEMPPAPTALDNFSYNRELWDSYSKVWADPAERRRNAEDLRADAPSPEEYEVLGLEWGNAGDADTIVEEWILPLLNSESVVGEIGTGGGRLALRVAPLVGEFWAFDNAPHMLQRVQSLLGDKAKYVLLESPQFPDELSSTFDTMYAFDVFVHFDLHLLWKYIQEIVCLLKPGGTAMLHTTNITAPAGWARFAAQDHFTVEGHYFVAPELVRTLVSHAGLSIERESSVSDGNSYLERDFLCVVRKPPG